MIDLDQQVEEGGFAQVGVFSTIQEANEYALVVLAMNLDCWIRLEAEPRRFALYADPAFAVAIREEFTLYAAEQQDGQAKSGEVPIVYKPGMELMLLWVMALVVVFLQQMRDASVATRFMNSNLALFDQGEIWRPFTSLFLHGDFGHLIGNVVIGGIFCVLVAHSLGQLWGWALILLSGTLGNILTCWIYYPGPFNSLGASTATFGALGILVGTSALMAWRARTVRKLGGAILPIGAGAILLGWFGAGGGNIDVLGHVCGFAMGALLGVAAWSFRSRVKAGVSV